MLVVDDGVASRRSLTRVLERLPRVSVAGTAASLDEARRRIVEGGIDAVTVELVVDGESGLDLVGWLAADRPGVASILLPRESPQLALLEQHARRVGAWEVVPKGEGPGARAALEAGLGRALDAVRTKQGSRAPEKSVPADRPVLLPRAPSTARELVVVGASTGGPPVVLAFLKSLPRAFDLPICIVQHMSAEGLPGFAEFLRDQSGRRVALAETETRLERGTVLVAPGRRHLVVDASRGELRARPDDGPAEHHCRPAVDPLFRSAAAALGARCVAVLMTGMGSDGARGALALRERGAPVVVQDEATSIVWGMPGAAVARGAVSAVAPAHELADWVRRWTA